MEFLYQRFWHSSVQREGDRFIRARTMYADSLVECAVELLVETTGLKILEAYWEKYGPPGDMADTREEIEPLKGIEAYLNQGPSLRQALQGLKDKMARSLVNETVTSIVQAETFLIAERGYANAEDYSRAWERFYAGTCRYYSNLEQVEYSWSDYIGNQGRQTRLFDRFKSQHLHREPSGTYVVTGNLRDSFHHLSLLLGFAAEDLRVERAEGSLMQVPDQVCHTSTIYLPELIGLDISAMNKKELAGRLGGSQGCVHLIDLVFDGVETLRYGLTRGS